jgi:hypothetical protein
MSIVFFPFARAYFVVLLQGRGQGDWEIHVQLGGQQSDR